jgi:hypothetical protein
MTLQGLIYVDTQREFLLVDWFHSSGPHSDRGAACCEAHTNFANESACLAADGLRNEVVTIQKSQEVLKMLALYMTVSFAINCSIKNTSTTIFLAFRAHQTPASTGRSRILWVGCGFCELQ